MLVRDHACLRWVGANQLVPHRALPGFLPYQTRYPNPIGANSYRTAHYPYSEVDLPRQRLDNN